MAKFFGMIEDFVFLPSPKISAQWNEFCLKNKGKIVSMDGRRVYKKRSLKQNKTLHGPWIDHCIKFHRYLGVQLIRKAAYKEMESMEAKWWIAVNFYPRRTYFVQGEKHQRIPGSSELDTLEMKQALDQYNDLCIDNGYPEFIPDDMYNDYCE